MRELRRARDRNADYCKKEEESMKRKWEKLENSFVKTEAELKAKNNRMNNAEEWISDLENRVMKITQSEHQTESQMKINKERKK